MKKIMGIFTLLITFMFILNGCAYQVDENGGIIYKYEDVSDILIRFHVIANSDSKEDQALKLQIVYQDLLSANLVLCPQAY